MNSFRLTKTVIVKSDCKVSLELGEKDDEIRMRVEALVEFEIANLSDLSTLRKDSAKYCSRKAIEDVIKKSGKANRNSFGRTVAYSSAS